MDLSQARDYAFNKLSELRKKDNTMCPALWLKVKFKDEWFSHITYKDDKHRRSEQEQIERFKCFLRVETIIKKSYLYQEFMTREEIVKVRDHWVTKKQKKLVEYYWLVGVVSHNEVQSRIRVVLRHEKWKDYAEFHSVIPSRKMRWYRNFIWPTE